MDLCRLVDAARGDSVHLMGSDIETPVITRWPSVQDENGPVLLKPYVGFVCDLRILIPAAQMLPWLDIGYESSTMIGYR